MKNCSSDQIHRITKPITITMLAMIVAVCCVLNSSQVNSQAIKIGKSYQEEKEDSHPNFYIPPSYDKKRNLKVAQQLLDEGNYDSAVNLLGRILQQRDSEDYFLSSKGDFSYRDAVLRLLGSMPPKARDAYEFQFGSQAANQLKEAIAAGNIQKLQDICRHLFHTNSSYQAAILLGRYHLSKHEPLAAAVYFKSVQQSPIASRYEPTLSIMLAISYFQAGEKQLAKQCLITLKKQFSNGKIMVGGSEISLFDKDDSALKWLQETIKAQPLSLQTIATQWLMPGGDPTRNSLTHGDQPLLRQRWKAIGLGDAQRFQFLDHKNSNNERHKLTVLRNSNAKKGVALLPCLFPLAVKFKDKDGKSQQVIISRTVKQLQAVDFRTGKMIWYATEIPPDGELLISSESSSADIKDTIISQRIWEDNLYGMLSTDGKLVFSIDHLGTATQDDDYGSPWETLDPNDTHETNILAARSLASEGKLRWEVGGKISRAEPKLIGAFFLGSPLVMNHKLYTLVELKSEIRLVVLNAATGSLLWQQQIMPVKTAILQDRQRRLAGASPSYNSGILVCPTSNGAVVAIDLATKSLKWGFRYGQKKETHNHRWRYSSEGEESELGNHWIDPSVVIAGSKALLTPVESEKIYCIDLLTGKKLWSRPRDKNILLAGTHKQIALFVSATSLTGMYYTSGMNHAAGDQKWKLNLGKSINKVPRVISGRGYMTGKYYFLPTTSGEVLKVDLADGKLVDFQKSIHGDVLGNLISFQGEVISLGVDGLATFRQIKPNRDWINRRLKKNPNDIEALSRLGEMELELNHPQQAVKHLRLAYAKSQKFSDKIHIRELYISAILKQLEKDFNENQPLIKEIQLLFNEESEIASLNHNRIRFQRIMSSGLQSQGKTMEAFRLYLRFYENINSPSMVAIDSARLIRLDRWVDSQLSILYQAAVANDKKTMELEIQKFYQQAIQTGTILSLRKYCQYFSWHQTAGEAQLRLANILLDQQEFLAAEQIALEYVDSKDNHLAGSATALLAETLIQCNRYDVANQYYHLLRTKYQNVVCNLSDQQTGKQLAESYYRSIGQQPPLRPSWNSRYLLAPKKKKKKKTPSNNRPSIREMYNNYDGNEHVENIPVTIHGRLGPFYQNAKLFFNFENSDRYKFSGGFGSVYPTGYEITVQGKDRLGNSLFKARLPLSSSFIIGMPSKFIGHARISGHLVMVSVGDQLVALNTINPMVSGDKRRLWRSSFFDSIDSEKFNELQDNPPWGVSRYQLADDNNIPVGIVGPITSAGVSFQRGEKLLLVDPTTGDVLWQRNDLPAGCELFGDDEILLAVARNQKSAYVIRLTDGELLGKREVPSQSNRICTSGRNILVWKMIDGKLSVGLFDPWNNKYLWKIPIAKKSKGTLVENNQFAVMQPDGRFRLISIADGKINVDEMLLPEEVVVSKHYRRSRLQEIFVIASDDQYMLITNYNLEIQKAKIKEYKKEQEIFSPNEYSPLISGRVYSIDRKSGKLDWLQPAAVKFQGLLRNQPCGIPLLIFARGVLSSDTKEEKRRRRSEKDSSIPHLYAIDKRTGKSIDFLNQPILNPKAKLQNIKITASQSDPDDQYVQIQLSKYKVKIRIDNAPQAPQPPTQLDDLKKKPKRGLRELWNNFWKPKSSTKNKEKR